MKAFVLFVCILFFSSCASYTEKELYGTYVPINYKNTTDTILLEPKGIYQRKVYDKNKNLALQMKEKWNLEKNTVIRFDSYFLNLDRDITKFPELLKDTLSGGGGLVESHNDTIRFCVGYYQNQNCYQKIK